MPKKFAIVHPDKTVTLKMPDVLFKIFSAAVRHGYVTIKFSDTQTGLRGQSSDAIIFDEYTDDPGLIEKLLTN